MSGSPKLHRAKSTLSHVDKHSHLYLLPIILLIIYFILSSTVAIFSKRVTLLNLTNATRSQTIVSYPFFSRQINPYLSAESAVVMDRDSYAVLYEKNSQTRFSMASTTKVMTALTALDYYKDSDILTARRSEVEGVNVGLRIGERMSFRDALYAMLLPSGNDVAYLFADNYPGGKTEFLKAMNEKAKSLHLENTHYEDPAGLNDDGNYTTARDLARLGMAASDNAELAKVMGSKSQFVTDVTKSHKFNLTNLNKLLGLYGVVGGKTGFTEGAEGVLMTIADIKERRYIVVVMRSEDRFLDTQQLLLPLQNSVVEFSPGV